MKTILIIPAYNEGESIERVVRNILDNYPQYDYIVWIYLKISGCRVRFRRV